MKEGTKRILENIVVISVFSLLLCWWLLGIKPTLTLLFNPYFDGVIFLLFLACWAGWKLYNLGYSDGCKASAPGYKEYPDTIKEETGWKIFKAIAITLCFLTVASLCLFGILGGLLLIFYKGGWYILLGVYVLWVSGYGAYSVVYGTFTKKGRQEEAAAEERLYSDY